MQSRTARGTAHRAHGAGNAGLTPFTTQREFGTAELAFFYVS